MSTTVTLFKTKKQHLQCPTEQFGVISFRNRTFATTDQDLEKYIKTTLMRDPALSIYIDPKEQKIDLETDMYRVGMRQEELQQFIYDQTRIKLEDSEYENGKVKPVGSADSVLTGGASGTHRFSASELAAARVKALGQQQQEDKKD